MATDRNELKRAVHSIMNDVVEQCFHHLIHHPHQGDTINGLIRDASQEIHYQCIKIDAHTLRDRSQEADAHYRKIAHDVQRKSLELLSMLQRIQREDRITSGGGQLGDSSSPFQSF